MNASTEHCPQLEEELALLAGCDLVSEDGNARELELRAHLEVCAGCQGLFEGLQGDQQRFAGLASAPASLVASPSLAASVVAQLELTEASRTAPRRAGQLSPWLQAAAALLVLSSATLIGLQVGRLPAPEGAQAGSSAEFASAGIEMARADDGSLRLSRSAGGAVELTWSGQAQAAKLGGQTPFRVLASEDPRFAATEAVEVAGLALVDSRLRTPSAMGRDARTLTFYKVR